MVYATTTLTNTARTIRRSTLADANHKRPAGLFEAVCQQLMAKVGRRFRQEVGDLLYLLRIPAHSAEGAGLRRLVQR